MEEDLKTGEGTEAVKPLGLEPPEEKEGEKKKVDWRLIAGGLGIVVFGVFSGWGLFRLTSGRGGGFSGSQIKTDIAGGEQVERGKTYGSTSEVFKDHAVGVIEKNGFDGEGTHKLLREGGESQTAYLTSSVLDLDLFVGHKVEIWGETFAAQKAGWLLDVGAVKVLD